MFIRPISSFLSYLWSELSRRTFSPHPPPDPEDRETPSTASPAPPPNASPQHDQSPPSPPPDPPNRTALCPACLALTVRSLASARGAPHHPTRAALRASADAAGCPLCAVLARAVIGITVDDGTLVPYGRFDGVFRVAAGVLAELRRMEVGRLRAVEVFEGAGKGLVGRVEEGEEGAERFFYLRLGVGGEMGERAAAGRTNSPASRLLDVQAFPPPCLDVRLVETRLEQDTSKYTALSHRWGTTATPFTTTRATLPDRAARIPFAALPRTFRHAVRATRALGPRYLWIDSLCIVQDSAADWAAESGRMGAIYARSHVTLAADCSGSSDGGLFNGASVMQDEEPLGKHVSLDVFEEEGEEEGRKCKLYVSEELAVPSHLDSRGVYVEDEDEDPDRMLVTRGWTLQEAVLAPRVLHYTSKQLIWECSRQGYVAEDMFSVSLRYIRPTYTEVKTQLQVLSAGQEESGGQGGLESVRARRLEILKTWYIQLVELRYAMRRLTAGHRDC
ncbi:het domain protein pin-c2 [Neofusicoccum parvum]|nr:het domain protein pin-c2 [Neofusicoccum parvum]